VASEIRVPIRHDSDIVVARQKGRELALNIGFKGTDLTLIATAISEVARNILTYAKTGEIVLDVASSETRRGLVVMAVDEGPGIPSIEDAMRDGFSTGKSLGLGLPGAKRLMDDFEIASKVGEGTTVTMKKWVH
jgi:serine/threonine-protein kinase RsbT